MTQTETQILREKCQEQHKRILKLESALQQAHNDLVIYIRLLEPSIKLKTVKQDFIHKLESLKLPIERALLKPPASE